MNLKKIIILQSVCAMFLVNASAAFAHVTVKPGDVGVGARTNFVVSVPTEGDAPTTQVRLLIPESLKSVRPNVKPGWNIQLVKSGEGEDARVSEIVWSEGSIPAEQRDEFVFNAQAPANETTLQWKAYQTYANGEVVAWDQDPAVVEEYTKKNPPVEGMHDENAPNPFSVTKVVNDLTTESIDMQMPSSDNSVPLLVSVIALAASALSLWIAMQKKKK